MLCSTSISENPTTHSNPRPQRAAARAAPALTRAACWVADATAGVTKTFGGANLFIVRLSFPVIGPVIDIGGRLIQVALRTLLSVRITLFSKPANLHVE